MRNRRFEADRVSVIAVAATATLALLTLLIYYVHAFHLVFLDPELGNVIESLSIIVVLGAFYLCYARFIMTNELRLLLLALAFLLLGLYNAVHAALVPLMGDRWAITPELLAYFWLTSRLISGVLLLASLWAGSRRTTAKRGVIGLVLVIVISVVLTLLFFNFGTSDLPNLISPDGWELVPHGEPSDVFRELTDFGGLYQLVIAATFLIAGAGYLQLYRKERRPFWGWLAISFIISFFSQINYMIYPSIFTDFVATGDFMRLLSRVTLFVGTYAEVSSSFREARVQNAELQALQHISTLGMRIRDVEQLLSEITSTVRDVFDSQTVVMFFPEEDGRNLVVRGPAVGLSDLHASQLAVPIGEDCLVADCFRGGVTVVSNSSGDRFIPAPLQNAIGIRTAIMAPLLVGNDTTGVLIVINRRNGNFGPEEARFLTIMAARAAMVIENARLHEQLEATAVIEERTHLAREIHDGLAQNLGYLNLMLPRVQAFVREEPQKAEEELGTMRKIVQDSLTEARQAIVDLQTTVSNKNFIADLTDYAREFSDSSDIEIEIISRQEQINLSAFARAELVRIVQEALNNVRRHAGATKVWIVFGGGNGSLNVEIIDNGRGFLAEEALSENNRRSFGLNSMQGRAARLGGELRIKSKPGEGTAVTVEVPFQEEAR